MAERITIRTETEADSIPGTERAVSRTSRSVLSKTRIATLGLATVAAICLLASPVAAQSSGTAFCGTDMATTIKNVFTLIQFGGPLVGGTIALGAVVATPYVRRADAKRDIKEIRNQAIVWGIIVAPLATTIVQFLLNDVVAGGASCSF